MPEYVKKCCNTMERLLCKYFVSAKYINIASYMAFQKLKILNHKAGLGDMYTHWLTYPCKEQERNHLNDLILNHLVSGEDLFCFMFFVIAVLDKFAMIDNSMQSHEIKNDILLLIGLLQLNIRDKKLQNISLKLNILVKYCKDRILKKYTREIGFGRAVGTILELHYVIGQKSIDVNTKIMDSYCCDLLDSLIAGLNSYLENELSLKKRARSVLSIRQPVETYKGKSATIDDISHTSANQETFYLSINGILLILLNFRTTLHADFISNFYVKNISCTPEL